MKILFITNAGGIDYLNDLVFHGLVELYGDDIIDSNYLWYISKTDNDTSNLYGHGFTITNNLKDRSYLDRLNIEDKISQHYFDIIVYGSIWRCADYYDIVQQHYNFNNIILLDGEDFPAINIQFKKGLYFKRELYNYHRLINTFNNNPLNVFPISFSIPKSKFISINYDKECWEAPMNPRNPQSYVYNNESDYYDQYNNSYFAVTLKKGGWDCLRHYEILAAGCLPYFYDYELCPRFTMTNWPSALQYDVNQFFNNVEHYGQNFNYDLYYMLLKEFYEYALNNFKTTDIANYIISKI